MIYVFVRAAINVFIISLFPAGLWNLVSLFSNLCLFVLMPFAYFFLESEGFAGSKKVQKNSFKYYGNICFFIYMHFFLSFNPGSVKKTC